MKALEEDVDSKLMHDCAYMPETAPILAGVGGTVTVLASFDRGLAAYDPALIEGWMIRTPRLEELVERVAASTDTDRAGWGVMGQGRSDIVIAGALVIRRLARRFRSAGLVCSTHGLRYGLARLAASEGMRTPGPAEPPAVGPDTGVTATAGSGLFLLAIPAWAWLDQHRAAGQHTGRPRPRPAAARH